MQIGPATQVGRTVEKDDAAFVADAGAENQHPVSSFSPEAGITEAGDGKSRRRSCDHGFGKLLPGAQVIVLRASQALHFTPGVYAVAQRGFGLGCGGRHPRVDHSWFSMVEHSAPTENAVAVGSIRSRGYGDPFVLPVDHVEAGSMRPIHVAPDWSLRIVLMEHVISPAKEDGAVGIVHPIVGGKQMVLRTKRVRGELATQGGAVVDSRGPREVIPRRSERRRTGELQECSSGDGHSGKALNGPSALARRDLPYVIPHECEDGSWI